MKKIIVLIIAVIPFNKLRILLWRVLCGYRISYSSKIGWGNVILAQDVSIEEGSIGLFNRISVRQLKIGKGAGIRHLNSIKLVNDFIMEHNSKIYNRNSFVGFDVDDNLKSFKCNFYLGELSLITHLHSFDITDTVWIGSNVVFGGKGTQLWTHGFDIYRNMITKPVKIGNDIYIGSMSIICQGVIIADKTVIGAGTCVSSCVKESGFYVSNCLIRKGEIKKYEP